MSSPIPIKASRTVSLTWFSSPNILVPALPICDPEFVNKIQLIRQSAPDTPALEGAA